MTADQVVRHNGIYYVCRLTPWGMKCGRCGRGNVGLWVVERSCRVCKAKRIKKWPKLPPTKEMATAACDISDGYENLLGCNVIEIYQAMIKVAEKK